jgi:hypothetical protein
MKSPCSGRDADIFVGGGTTKDPLLVGRPKIRILRKLRMTQTLVQPVRRFRAVH